MPKPGFKSITVNEHIYNSFISIYDENKMDLSTFGINSFSAFLTYILNGIFTHDEIWNSLMMNITHDQAAASKGLIRTKK